MGSFMLKNRTNSCRITLSKPIVTYILIVVIPSIEILVYYSASMSKYTVLLITLDECLILHPIDVTNQFFFQQIQKQQ